MTSPVGAGVQAPVFTVDSASSIIFQEPFFRNPVIKAMGV